MGSRRQQHLTPHCVDVNMASDKERLLSDSTQYVKSGQESINDASQEITARQINHAPTAKNPIRIQPKRSIIVEPALLSYTIAG